MGLLGPGDEIRQLYYGRERRFNAFIYIEFKDGTNQIINTDGNWRITMNGPIRAADHFMGEEYNSNMKMEGWSTPGYNDSDWEDSYIDDSINIITQPQMHEPIQIFKEFKPVKVFTPEPDVYIYDMGQNIAGICQISLDGPNAVKHNVITLQHGEMLNDDGTLHIDNLRLAHQKDIYTCNEAPKQVYRPRFTFHGFRYVEIRGLKKILEFDSIKALAMGSNPEISGYIETSHEMINKLISNIYWTQRNNMLTVPTDCPQRNERMGWMGDIYGFCQASIYNLNMAAFLTKFCINIRDDQTDKGQYPDFAVCPRLGCGG